MAKAKDGKPRGDGGDGSAPGGSPDAAAGLLQIPDLEVRLP